MKMIFKNPRIFQRSTEGKLVRFMPDDELMTFLNHL